MNQRKILNKFAVFLDVTSAEYLKKINTRFVELNMQAGSAGSVVIAAASSPVEITHLDKDARNLNDIKTMVELNKVQQEHEQHVKALCASLRRSGYCLAFSIVDGKMDVRGKLDWWDAALSEIEAWDEQLGSLDVPLMINGSVANKPTTLRTLMEYSLNEIVFNQTEARGGIENFIPDGFTETTLSNNSVFEIHDERGRIKPIKLRESIAGSFQKEDLKLLLSESVLKDAIVLISSEKHTIRIAYKNEGWMVKDPNFVRRYFSSQDEMIDNLFSCLETHSMGIEVMAYNKISRINFLLYQRVMENSLVGCISHHGLHMMARYAPQSLPLFLSLAKQSSRVEEIAAAMMAALGRQDSKQWTGLHMLARFAPECLPMLLDFTQSLSLAEEMRQTIFSILTRTSSKQWTGLHMLARYAPDSLVLLLNLVKLPPADEEIRSAIFSVLTKKTSYGWTGLHVIARYAPKSLSLLLNLARQSIEDSVIRLDMVSALAAKNADKWTGLHMMACYAPQSLSLLFDFAMESSHGQMIRASIVSTLAEKNIHEETGWFFVANYAPKSLPLFIEIALFHHVNMKYTFCHVLKILVNQPSNHPSLWQIMQKNAPSTKVKIVKRLSMHLEKLNAAELLVVRGKISAALQDETSAYRGLCKRRPTLFHHGDYGKTSLWRMLMEKIENELAKKSGVSHVVARRKLG